MGEITRNDPFGADIIRIVKQYNIRNVIEIGSWDGTGSTQCFIEGMKDFDNKRLVCLEVYEDRFNQLKQNTANYPWVECYRQSSISHQNMLYTDFNEIWNSPFNHIPKTDQNGSRKELVNKWFDDDVRMIKSFKTGYLEDHPNDKYDAALIDGGEFSGYFEYRLLKNRVNFFFLDDYYNAFKTRQVAEELANNADWEPIAGNKYLRNGYAVFKRK